MSFFDIFRNKKNKTNQPIDIKPDEKLVINPSEKPVDYNEKEIEYKANVTSRRLKRGIKKNGKKKRSNLNIIAIVVVAIIFAFFIAYQFVPSSITAFPRRFFANILTPISDAISTSINKTKKLIYEIVYFDKVVTEYEKLLEEVNTLKDQNQRMDALEIQLNQYRELDDEIKRNKSFDGISAEVIGVNNGNYNRVLVIDKGYSHGIKANMAVAVPGALVGYTFDVEKNKSSVRCIIDPESSVAAIVENTRDQGTLSGRLAQSGKHECRMYYLSYNILPRPDDRIVTSGVGFEFPKGIPIGYVRETTRGLEDSKQYIVVEPIADFDHIENVIVYRYVPPYSEPANERSSFAQSTYIPVPTVIPQATFFGQKSLLTPTPEALSSESPSPSPTLRPTFTPIPDNLKPNFSYNEKPQPKEEVSSTAEIESSPTNTPKPTFSVDQLTIEEDE